MMETGKTTFFSPEQAQSAGTRVTVFDCGQSPRSLELDSFGKDIITFGREPGNDLVLYSPLVSRIRHGEFVRVGALWMLRDMGSTNGIIYNGQRVGSRFLSDGDLFRIDQNQSSPNGVLFVISGNGALDRWRTVPVGNRLVIGRAPDCGVVLPHITVSQHHAVILREAEGFVLYDTRSTNGILLNGSRVNGKALLHEKDVIVITNSTLIFSGQALSYCTCSRRGISVDTSDVVIVRKQRGRKQVTAQRVSLDIRPGELVSIIGGSGAGKSTILNAMCGYLPPSSGSVFINGVDLYQNFDALKRLIGYVPQSDIVYDNLTLYDMLSYAAKLRLPKDCSPQDREQAITRAISTVELTEKRGALIKNLSGGQKKRASIAVELLSDPNLLFLDEPTSGLDPGTERNLMRSLRAMADSGKTVILVTHSTLQLRMCDKIVFMGRNGYLCFCGPYDEALRFFGVSDIVDIYNLISQNPEEWSRRYNASTPHHITRPTPFSGPSQVKEDLWGQLKVLCARYMKLILNDRQRLLLLLFQAPILAFLISFVADGEQFEQYEMTKSLLFALSCSAFWVGMLNAIQEICKERSILKREYMTGLRLDSYILSKLAVLGLLSAVQSVLLTGVFTLLVGTPDDSVMLPAFLELLMTTFLTALSSASMGLLVSALFTNPDRAMTVAPILLMPQILFSGLIFKLDGATELLSLIAICRWSMEGYGTTANLNSLPLRLQQQGVPIDHDREDFFEFDALHMLGTWGILLLYTAVFSVAAWLVLRSIRKEKE